MASEAPGATPPPTAAERRAAVHLRIRTGFASLALGCSLVLATLYLAVSDLTPWGEYFTVWPPVLWLLGLVPLAALGTTRKAKRQTLTAWAAVALYIVATHEVRPMLRAMLPTPTAKRDLRVVTWNVGGTSDMSAVIRDLKALEPDICLIQEYHAPLRREGLEPFETRWPGMYAEQSGELVIVSRYTFRPLRTRPVGPWSDPQLALADLGSSRTLLLANVRLMLPSLVLNPFEKRAREALVHDNSERVAQFPKLVTQLLETKNAEKPSATILGGDFNTASHSKSLWPIQKFYTDSWLAAGRGWGGTCTAQFPVARIDPIYSSPGLRAINAEVGASTTSDHRPYIADFTWAP